MKFDDLRFDWSFVQWALMAVIGVYSWLVGRQSASAKEMLDMRIRITALEEQVKQMPSKSELARVEARLESAAQQLTTAVRRLDNINDYLLSNK